MMSRIASEDRSIVLWRSQKKGGATMKKTQENKTKFDRNVLIPASASEALVRGRIARRMEDLDEETLKALAAAEVPARFAYLDEID